MNKRVTLQGVSGSFHHLAAVNYEGSPVEVVGRRSFDEVVHDVMHDDSVHYGLMAIENSIAGTLLKNYTLIKESGAQIIGETFLRIQQNLLAIPGVKIENLREVHSHPIALAQCELFFERYPDIRLVSTYDTAESAYEISQSGREDVAAIASSLAGEMYQLETLAESIETNKQNYTRFLVVDKKLREEEFDKISISFRVSHEIGSLYKALENLCENNCNLTKIQSVPIIGEPWQYLFFADFTLGNPENLDKIVNDLGSHARNVTVLGKYKQGLHYES